MIHMKFQALSSLNNYNNNNKKLSPATILLGTFRVKEPWKTVADDIPIFFFFLEKIRLELSTWKSKNSECGLDQWFECYFKG